MENEQNKFGTIFKGENHLFSYTMLSLSKMSAVLFAKVLENLNNIGSKDMIFFNTLQPSATWSVHCVLSFLIPVFYRNRVLTEQN